MAGKTLLQEITAKLVRHYNVKPLIEAEHEAYCFGPGQPITSSERWAVPFGIQGKPGVIKTSSIADGEGSRIPFLAGQDWMVFMDACLDIGQGVVIFREIEATAPLLVDVTGHLVVAIDEMPEGGWPQGLVARKDGYPGVLFEQIGRQVQASSTEQRVFEQAKFAPTHLYEPDNSAEPLPCTAAADHWEFQVDRQVYVRHHLRPRTVLFSPDETLDSPDLRALQPVRVTVKSSESVPSCDQWGDGCGVATVPWVGATYFFGKGADASHVVFPTVSDEVNVQFHDGTCRHVKPHQLSLMNRKKIQHFDLKKSRAPEAPPPLRRGRFSVPPGEFGSGNFDTSPLATGVHEERQLQQPTPTGGAMAQHRRGHHGGVRPGLQGDCRERGDPECQAPHAGTDELRGGHPRQGDLRGDDASDSSSSDDGGPRAEQEGHPGPVPPRSSDLSAPGGRGQEDGQCTWEIPGVPELRDGMVRPSVSGADHQGGDPGVPVSTWTATCTRRNHQASGRRPPAEGRGIFKKLARMLLVLSALLGDYGPAGLTEEQGRLLDTFAEQQSGQRESWRGVQFGARGGRQPQELEPGGTGATGAPRGTTAGGQAAGGGPSTQAGLPGGPQHSGAESGLRGERFPGLMGVGGDDLGHGDGRRALKPGQTRRMQDRARQALAAAKVHRQAVLGRIRDSRWPRKHFRFDLFEIFSGSGRVSIRAVSHWGLRVIEPVGFQRGMRDGWSVRQWLLDTLNKFEPRLVVMEDPRAAWAALSGHGTKPPDHDTHYDPDRDFTNLVAEIFEYQASRGGHAVFEATAGSDLYNEPVLRKLRDTYHETHYNLTVHDPFHRKGHEPVQQVRFVATHRALTEALDRCGQDHLRGRGGINKSVYSPDIGDAICRAYVELQGTEDFAYGTTWATTTARAVNYVDVKRDEDEWRVMLEHAKELLARKVQSSLLIHPGTDFYKKVCELVPWEIKMVQVSYLPKAKRVRAGLEECHRASILLLNDGTVEVETEFLREAQAPRERFVTPVPYAIFVLGHAPGEPDRPAPAALRPVQPMPGEEAVQDEIQQGLVQEGVVRQDFNDEVWFVGGPLKEKEKAVARALVRAHRNLGHPRQEDFTRALAHDPKVLPEAIALSRRLRCATCERTRRPLPPRPSTLKTVGPFNSKVCLDFVYLYDYQKECHRFLHVLEPNGSYNIFYPSKSRVPEEVFELFCDVWSSWAGFPEYIHVDKDGAFEGFFAERMQALGVDMDAIPAEAHWQAGSVEAYNRAFRYAAEKLIDEKQLSGDLEMKILAASVSASMNEKIRTCGCSPNEWLFGRHPRNPWDLLSVDGKVEALQGLDTEAELRRRQQIRALADQKIDEFATNDSLRKAILRQGRPTRQSYEPGELVAFWRAPKVRRDAKTRKGKRVPGGWYRATVIGPHKGDQGQNNYWVTSGGRCILVAREQMRPAYGTELWRIREEDLRDVLDQPPRDYLDERSEIAPEETASLPGEVIPLYGDDPEEDIEYVEGDLRGELPLREVPEIPHEPHGELPREPHGELHREPHGELRREPHGELLGPSVEASIQDVGGVIGANRHDTAVSRRTEQAIWGHT